MGKTQNIKLAVDAVVFGYHQKKLQLLLIKQKFGKAKGLWSLPGGFVLDDEGKLVGQISRRDVLRAVKDLKSNTW